MRYYLQCARHDSPSYHRIFDTITGIVYNYHLSTQTLQVWSIHNNSDSTLKFDGDSTLPFWNALVASATHVDPPNQSPAIAP